MKKLLGTSLLLVSGAIFAFDHDGNKSSKRHGDYTHITSKTLSLAADDLSQFIIAAGAGSLKVVGSERDDIVVLADVYSKSGDSEYCLSLEKESSNIAELAANTCNMNFNTQMLIDLEVKVPHSLLTKIKDSSGSITIEGASVKSIKDGSGSIRIEDNRVSLKIDDGSGSISITDVEGDLDIEDGSGSINVKRVAGHVTIDDGSGSISVTSADKFTLIDDGSGSVNLTDVNQGS